MKTFEERMASIRAKSAFEKKKTRNRRIAAGILTGVFTVALTLVLFIPYSTALPDVSRYADSPYYHVIRGLNQATYQAPRFRNNFDMLLSNLATLQKLGTNMSPAPGDDVAINGVPGVMTPEHLDGTLASPDFEENGDQYQEVTDSQVAGVIEADLFKRSDKYLYYLHDNELRVYSIAQENSALVGSAQIDPFAGTDVAGHCYSTQMYLTQDCTTVIIMMDGYTKETGSAALLVSVDVSDPANMTVQRSMMFRGAYISSRMVGDDILLTYNYGLSQNDIRFDDPKTFVPMYGTPGDLQCMDADAIICPEEAPSTRYTVIAKLKGKSLEVYDTVALMSYSQELYVSEDTIFATHSFTHRTDTGVNKYDTVAMTEITGIAYRGDSMEILGSVQLEGSVKDQYSMDQYNGILRVAASTIETRNETYHLESESWSGLLERKRNCSLYCINLSTWQIVASVEKFAPEGDEVTSARFDGDMAYICTAEVIVLTDPVYFFDLSDLNNITWTDTGIIDGYSSSLVNFGDYLLGIGFGDDRGLKLEAYAEGAESVESLGVYNRSCSFSPDYKSYYIDREHNLVGIAVNDWMDWNEGERSCYLLLQFDGYKFRELKKLPMEYYSGHATRATMIDGWLYVLYDDHLIVQQVLDFDEDR